MLFWVSKTSCIKNNDLIPTFWRWQSWWYYQVCKRYIIKGVECSIIYWSSKWEFGYCRFVTKSWIDLDTYMQALQILLKGHRIILQWNPCDIFINAWNWDVLHLWGGNIDLQYVEDEYSTIMYVCSYMIKSEEAMKRVAKEIQNDDMQTQMNKIKKFHVDFSFCWLNLVLSW